ncbi:MAG: DUF4912 domain-containing protein [Candidatus Hydrogenedentota bacterium]
MEGKVMTAQDLSKMTKDELFEVAKDKGLFITKKMKKGEIIEAILDKEKQDEKERKRKEELLKKSETKQVSSQPASVVAPTQAPPSRIPGPYVPQLPKEYGKDRLLLLVRDPHWVFAYWELTEKSIQKIRKKIGEETFKRSTIILRMHDVTDIVFNGTNSHASWDIDVNTRLGTRHINVWGTDRNYLAELGYRTPSGTFIRALLSNTISVPRGKVSDRIDENWMIVEETYKELLEASGMQKIGASSAEVPSLAIRHVPGELKGLEMALASEAVSSWGSQALVREKPKKGRPQQKKEEIKLLVNTDLVLYGYASLGCEVTVASNKIKVNPDGTFSVRFALKDGVHKLDVEAKKQGISDIKRIPIEVRRKTG